MVKGMIIGLTGGIASGKSLVAEVFMELGAFIVDADVIARQVVEPGTPAYDEIFDEFGPEVIKEDGTIDRSRLASTIFADRAKREKLNAITHPRIREKIKSEVDRLKKERPGAIVVVDAALLFENKLIDDVHVDATVVVYADEDKRRARLKERDGLSDEEARRRIAAQMPIEEKIKLADHVIENNATREEAARAARRLFKVLDRTGGSGKK